MKNWLQWNPDRNGTIGLLLILVAFLGIFAAVVIYAPDIHYRNANAGFGPDWQCIPQGQGDPVCIKKPAR
jgi:hypothetical protein